MEIINFAKNQYKNFNQTSRTARAVVRTTQKLQTTDEKLQTLARAYSVAKPVFEKIRQENKDFKPQSLFQRVLKPIVLSVLNLTLAFNIFGMKKFLSAHPVKMAPIKPAIPASTPAPAPAVPAPAPKQQLPQVAEPQKKEPEPAPLLMLDQGQQAPAPANNEKPKDDPFAHLNPFDENGKFKPWFKFNVKK